MDPTPFLTCQDHGPVPWYCVCVHVLRDGAPVAHFVETRASAAGEVLCARCTGNPDLAPDDLRAICCHCVDRLIADRR